MFLLNMGRLIWCCVWSNIGGSILAWVNSHITLSQRNIGWSISLRVKEAWDHEFLSSVYLVDVGIENTIVIGLFFFSRFYLNCRGLGRSGDHGFPCCINLGCLIWGDYCLNCNLLGGIQWHILCCIDWSVSAKILSDICGSIQRSIHSFVGRLVSSHIALYLAAIIHWCGVVLGFIFVAIVAHFI